MNRRDFLQTLGVAVPAAAATSLMSRSATKDTKRESKDVAERILDTRQINYSYIPNGPLLMVDPNTGKLSGVFYDLTQRLGEIASLEIKWHAETTFATYPEDLRMKKCDAVACGIWPSVKRAAVANFSLPAFYSGVGIYVRHDDHRFDRDTAQLNDPRFRLAILDGEMAQTIQESDFPKASLLSLPNNTDISMLAESVVSGKADATFMEKALAAHYMQKNPGALRNATDAKPIRIFENTWAFAYGSDRLKAILDTAMKEMIYSGYIEQILSHHGQDDAFYPVRSPVHQ